MNTRGFVFLFRLKDGRGAFYNPETKEFAVEIDYSQLIEPTVMEMAEIINYAYETEMDAFVEVHDGETNKAS